MLTNISAEILYEKVVNSLRLFFKNNRKDKAIVGLSGGIDSALVAAIAVETLGAGSVSGILMPSPFSTMHSVSDAMELSNNLGIKYKTVPIEGIFNRYLRELTDLFGENPGKLTVENLQARIRSTILMAASNQTGALVLNTSNKSELSMGYGTLYGDLSGAIMVIGDIYKLDVYELAHYINSNKKVIPDSVLTKEPSAELSIGQKDSDSIPPYPVLDPILYSLHEEGKSPDDIVASGVDRALMNKILMLKSTSAFKGYQLPPMIQIGDYPLVHANKCL